MDRKDEQTLRFEALYREFHQRVFQTCLRFAGGDRQWAIDRVHDTFMKLTTKMGELDGLDDLGGWLYCVAVKQCLMELRRQRLWLTLRQKLLPFGGRQGASPEAQVQARRDLSGFELALEGLPPKQRALMIIIHVDGKSQTEAAEVLGLSKGQVSKLYKKAMTALQAHDWETAFA